MLVQTRRNEQPDLIEHPRHRQHDAEINAEIDYQADVAGRARVVELVVEMIRAQSGLHRRHDEVDEALRNEQTDDHSGADADQRGDDPLAQFDQMVEKRHLRAGFFFGCLQRRALRLGGFRHLLVTQDCAQG